MVGLEEVVIELAQVGPGAGQRGAGQDKRLNTTLVSIVGLPVLGQGTHSPFVPWHPMT